MASPATRRQGGGKVVFGRLQNRKGTSLIEILAALAVLVVGILSVARMFSGGFRVMKRSENITFASRLAEKEFERLRANSDTLPLGIKSVDDPQPIPGPPLTDANLHSIRQIVGETVKIPGPSLASGVTGAVMGSVHELTFAPVDSIDSVYSAPMQRRVMDSDNAEVEPWYWLSQTQYAIDYDNAKICFRAVGYARVFNIAYAYWTATDTGRALHTATGVAIHVPANTTEWLDIPGPSGGTLSGEADFQELDDRSDQVSRGFVQIPVAQDFSPTNPYEYKVADGLLGRIVFNPIGYTFKETTPAGTVELTAHIDYKVFDWGIINEVFEAPTDAPYRIRTTLKNLKQSGVTINDDGSLYGGIVSGGASPANQDVILVDQATGALIPVGGSGGAKVDYEAGVITLPAALPDGTTTMAGRVIRVFYRAQGDWQGQGQKGYELYTANDQRNVPFNQYRLVPGTVRVYLSRLDAGKSFSVDYVYDDSGTERTVVGEVHRAEDGLDLGPPENAYFELNHPASYIRALRGLSLKVRVVWSEGTRVVNDQIVPRYQYYDLDGELSRTISAL